MKKTLITLAALAMASVASADTTWKALDSVTSTAGYAFYDDYVHTLNDFTFQFYIPEDTFTAGSELIAYVNGNAPSDGAANRQYSFVLHAVAGGYNLEMGRSNLSTTAPVSFSSSLSTGLLTSGVVYTVAYSTSMETPSGTASKNNPAVVVSWEGEGNKYTRLVSDSGQLVFDAQDTTPTAMINSAYAVPEPTTATLSLLALAGLAARRRRK